MALVVELAEDQLTVGAIHRTVSGLPDGFDLVGALAEWFDVVRAGAADTRTLGRPGGLQLADPDLRTGRPTCCCPGPRFEEQAGNDLDSSLIATVLGPCPSTRSCTATAWPRPLEALESGEGQAAFLLRPVTVKQIDEWANERRRMPPKTTFFSPKAAHGMVFRSLDSGLSRHRRPSAGQQPRERHAMHDSVTIHMKASPQQVWDLVSDVTRIGRYSPETFEAEWVDGATGPATGAKFRGHVKRNGKGPSSTGPPAPCVSASPGRSSPSAWATRTSR